MFNFLGFGCTAGYVKKINELKNANSALEKEKVSLSKQLYILDKAKKDLEDVLASYMTTIETLKERILTFEQTDMNLSSTKRQIIEAARKGEYIYTVIFPDGVKTYERVLKTAVVPSKVAIRNAAKRFGLSQSGLKGTKTDRWEL